MILYLIHSDEYSYGARRSKNIFALVKVQGYRQVRPVIPHLNLPVYAIAPNTSFMRADSEFIIKTRLETVNEMARENLETRVNPRPQAHFETLTAGINGMFRKQEQWEIYMRDPEVKLIEFERSQNEFRDWILIYH